MSIHHDTELLRHIALQLHHHATQPSELGAPTLLIVHVDPDHPTSQHRIERRTLTDPDPVVSLIGVRAEPTWRIAGVITTASAQAGAADRAPSPCTLLHLQHRHGDSMTIIGRPDAAPITLEPDSRPRDGRIPDACRRIFGLSTSPAPTDMTAFVLDAWLTLILRAALLQPGLGWAEIEQLNFAHRLIGRGPSAATSTPALLAERTREAAAALDWGRYRLACTALGGCPVSDLTPEAIDWMDTGMFARWSTASLPDTGELLDLLEPVVEPHAFDRLWATISLSHPDPLPDPTLRHLRA